MYADIFFSKWIQNMFAYVKFFKKKFGYVTFKGAKIKKTSIFALSNK